MVFVRPPLPSFSSGWPAHLRYLEREKALCRTGAVKRIGQNDHVGYLAVISTLYNIILNYVVHNILTSNTQGFLVPI